MTNALLRRGWARQSLEVSSSLSYHVILCKYLGVHKRLQGACYNLHTGDHHHDQERKPRISQSSRRASLRLLQDVNACAHWVLLWRCLFHVTRYNFTPKAGRKHHYRPAAFQPVPILSEPYRHTGSKQPT